MSEILNDLNGERTVWLDLKKRVERTASLDGKLNTQYKDSNNYMNAMLEEYFEVISGGVILEPVRQAEDYSPEDYDGA